jgi:hypothetical protein
MSLLSLAPGYDAHGTTGVEIALHTTITGIQHPRNTTTEKTTVYKTMKKGEENKHISKHLTLHIKKLEPFLNIDDVGLTKVQKKSKQYH